MLLHSNLHNNICTRIPDSLLNILANYVTPKVFKKKQMDLKVLHYQRACWSTHLRSVGREIRLCVYMMLMHHASECVLLVITPRRQCASNGATGLKSTPPKACKEDACECAPQAHLIIDAQSMHIRESWQMSNKVLPYAHNHTT